MKTFLIALALISIASCQSRNTENENTPTKLQPSDEESEVRTNEHAVNYKDFEFFWKDFRRAVLDQDSIKLLSMTMFPLLVQGYEDQDPQLSIKHENLMKTINLYLANSPNYVNEDCDTNLDFFWKTVKILNNPAFNEEKESARVGDMIFVKSTGNWYLNSLFLNTKEMQPM